MLQNLQFKLFANKTSSKYNICLKKSSIKLNQVYLSELLTTNKQNETKHFNKSSNVLNIKRF